MTGHRQRRVTIRDVAASAKVSISTVSHVFSGRRPISDATRDRVLIAASELGYNANPAAVALRSGRSGVLGLILRPRDAARGAHEGSETFTRFTGTIATEILDRKLALVQVPDIFDPTASRVPMDGCIVGFPYANDDVIEELRRRNIPTVAADADPQHRDDAWTVRLDHHSAVTNLLNHLAEEGADRIWLLAGTEDNAWNRFASEAFETWHHDRAGEGRELRLYEGEGRSGATKLFTPILESDDRPDAVVAISSRFGAGIADAANALSIRVPTDLMIATVTDSSLCRENDPPLTAIDLVLEDLGQAAVDLLLAQLSDEPAPEAPLVLSPRLHIRGSTLRR